MNTLQKPLLLLAPLLFLALSITGSAKPNFIIIIGDDVGWDAFGCTGMKEARTPAIDQLAKQSCMMDRFYCSVSQCAPCRAEMYTGLYPINNGVLANSKKLKRPGVKNVADHLRPLGYQVGLTGKRHFSLGSAQIDNIPGFDSNGNGSGQVHRFDGVEAYINKAKAGGDAFCVFICSTHAHHPWDHGRERHYPLGDINLRPHYVDSPAARQAVAKHAAEVEVLDRQVKETRELMRTMDLEKDTVLIFLSEQGIAMPRGKWSPYEHGSRALCLAHWQGKILPRRTSALSMYCDLVPTLIDYAGGAVDETLDGKSLRALWTDETVTRHRDAVLLTNVHPFWQKALVTDTYKLIWTGHPERQHIMSNFTSNGKFFAKPWGEWTALADTDKAAASKVRRIVSPKPLELYDVAADPYELTDLAATAEHAERVTRMHRELKAMMTKVGESLEIPEPVVKEKKAGKRKRQKSKQ